MAKKKAPARKGGKKAAAPTKGAKKRTVPELRKAAKARMDDHSDKRKFDALSGTLSIHQDGVELGSVQVPVVDNGVNVMLPVPGAASLAKIAEPTLFLGEQVVFVDGAGDAPSSDDFGVFAADNVHPTVEEQWAETVDLMKNGIPNKPGLLRRAWNRVKHAFRYRSAITGLFVSKAQADANPHTTVKERMK